MAIDRQESPYRRGNRYPQLPIPMVTEHCIPVDAGAVQLVVESRKLTNEIIKGAYDDAVDSRSRSTTSAPRSTCAEPPTASSTCASTASRTSRTTTTSSRRTARTPWCASTSSAVGDPIDFSLACVEHHLPDMLRHCGVDDLADTVAGQPEKVDAAVAEVRELMEKARYPVA